MPWPFAATASIQPAGLRLVTVALRIARFLDLANTFDTNNLTVARNSEKIDGTAADLTVATEGAAFSLVYSGSTYGWKLTEK